jgi:hypothetical protein
MKHKPHNPHLPGKQEAGAQSPAAPATGKRQHPVGVCKTCGGLTFRMESINERCGRSPRGHRCSGSFANASRDADWKECVSCKATGKIGAAPCIYCKGVGWSLAKPWSL